MTTPTLTPTAAVWEGPGVVRPAALPDPEVPDGWALLDVACTGICGSDLSILRGAPHVCSRLGLHGIDAPGGLATRLAVPPDRLHELPGDVDPRTAALVEPGAWRREVARGFGLPVAADGDELTAVLDGLTGGEGADTTFDTAAHPAVAARLSATTRVLGRIADDALGLAAFPTTVFALADVAAAFAAAADGGDCLKVLVTPHPELLETLEERTP